MVQRQHGSSPHHLANIHIIMKRVLRSELHLQHPPGAAARGAMQACMGQHTPLPKGPRSFFNGSPGRGWSTTKQFTGMHACHRPEPLHACRCNLLDPSLAHIAAPAENTTTDATSSLHERAHSPCPSASAPELRWQHDTQHVSLSLSGHGGPHTQLLLRALTNWQSPIVCS